MQINRLFEIIYILLEKPSITAKELAAHFEVSVRTVYRDIDTLCQAGIPIYTSKGRGGGISLLDNFVLDKSVLSGGERKEILWALQGLHAVKAGENEAVLSRMQSFFGDKNEDWIRVDFSDWNDKKQETFQLIKEAAIYKKVLEIEYYNTVGEKSLRMIEPIQLWFKDKAWYIKAYCRHAEGIRLFRISRVKMLRLTEEHFERELPREEKGEFSHARDAAYMVTLTLQIDASCAYRIYDEYEESEIELQEDGSFIAKLTCPENDWVYGYLLSYGKHLKVLEPERIRILLKEKIQDMSNIYI